MFLPDDLWWSQYRRYLASPIWKALRQVVLARDGHRCRRCGSSKRLQVDHLSYTYYNQTGVTRPQDCQTLCYSCHQRKTTMARKKNGNGAILTGMSNPQDELDWAMHHAVDKAVMAHPQTQSLRKQILSDMQAAAKGSGTVKGATPAKENNAKRVYRPKKKTVKAF